ncbi:MAG TPA: type ISP restriction/modification enzyme [Flavipsychrobacter sp.]|nr:type ISP restriction/modification enzyme [Flavipsychrobacter sp.]
MSIHAIKEYQRKVENIIHFGGTKKETAIRNAFQSLLDEYAKQKGLMLIPEITIKSPKGNNVTPDGTLKDSLRQDWGYWESKDEADDIDEEIRKKFAKGYPNDNILFEDSAHAVLIQHGDEVMRISMKEAEDLDKLIHAFINYERAEVKSFRKAIEHFKEDIPKVTTALRGIIEEQKDNKEYRKKLAEFLELCKEAINPDVSEDDAKEMMIQHILTADIFNTIFDEPHFHRENNVAKELEKVVESFFTRTLRQQTLNAIKHYYDAINAAAAGIADHHEKQKFLKVVYETFYKSYNPKAADRLGVVYTPNEIVRFMVESTDYLSHKYFGKFLEDKGVEILDPATGTGTFICDIIDHIRKDKLEYKYKNELHANEVAILPYYISNLNIEFTYKQKTGEYAEFEHLCFMDTLDNLGFKRARQNDLFNPFTEENSKRIMRQNSKKMTVVIGNPPYNAKQENYNSQNANRQYTEIDQRIKETFIKNGTAQNQIVVYDMYTRFYRWAFDRIQDNGIVAFVTNRSFIDGRAFDGFRKVIQDEFDFAYIIDTKSDVRANPKISGTGHNVFGIQTGVAIMFLVKKEGKGKKKCTVQYVTMDDFWKKEEKLQWLIEHKLETIPFDHITPDKKNSWINQSNNDFDSLIALIDKEAKSGKNEKAIFKNFSSGLKTGRDEWAVGESDVDLTRKMTFLINHYNSQVEAVGSRTISKIKWDENLSRLLEANKMLTFSKEKIVSYAYRPFLKKSLYYSSDLNQRGYQWPNIYKLSDVNKFIAINSPGNTKDFHSLASNNIIDLHFTGDSQCLPLYSYHKGEKIDNITDWAVEQFANYYLFGKRKDQKKIKEAYHASYEKGMPEGALAYPVGPPEKEDIFYYVYGVLHNPAYREKYALNLKRDFPRIPFYDNFWDWVRWGQRLMDLHINYETVEPYELKLTTKEVEGTPKTKLKADKAAGTIALDEATTISGIPPGAWDYKLGNRSALEWILDQYKESKPKDPTIAEKFNTYKFADYKEQVIDLIKRVCTVSVETVKVVSEMKNAE